MLFSERVGDAGAALAALVKIASAQLRKEHVHEVHLRYPRADGAELKRAFMIGFYLYLPFVLIDVVVASTLMSMGMIMLPPSMISMPFKLLLFISLNGWELLFSTLVRGFN